MRASLTLLVAIAVGVSFCSAASTGSASPRPKVWVVWKKPRLTLQPRRGWRYESGPSVTRWIGHDFGGIYFQVLPRRVYSPRTHRPAIRSVDFLVWLQHHPLLRAGHIYRVRLGNVVARVLDGRVVAADDRAYADGYCGETMSQAPCVPLTADPNIEGYVSWALEPGDLFRIIEIETNRGSLAIEIDPPEKAADEFKLSAMGVLSTLHQMTH
jgi:hypothetical protein